MNLMENMGLTPKENKREIKLIRYDRLIASPDNFYHTDDIDDLKRAILLAGGVRQNLIVQPAEEGMYTIISGHRRLRAVRELILDGREDIPDTLPCEVETNPDIADLLLITTNSTTRKLSDWERIKQFERLEKLYERWKAEGKTTQKKRDTLSQMLGDSRTGIARIQAISNNLSPILLGCLQNGILGISVAYEASKLTQEQQEKFYHKCCASGQFDLNAIRKMVQKDKVDADVPEQTTVEDYTGGETIKQTGNVQERREYIPLKKQNGCEILLRMLKIDGEYDTIVEYCTPEHAGKKNIGRYPNIASARMAAIGKTKDIDQCMRTALADAGLISVNEWGDTPDTVEQQANKQTGDYYDKCLKKMQKEGLEALEPCERCTLATACEKCCKTCTNQCNDMQGCYKDKAEENKKKNEDEPDETVEKFIERVKNMRHSRTYYTRDRRGNIEINSLGCNALLDIGEADETGMPMKELDIVNNAGSIGVIVYKTDELAYGIAIRGQLEYVDAIIGDDITIIGNVLKNPEVLKND